MPEPPKNETPPKSDKTNPGPNAYWCEKCQAWKITANVKVVGEKSSDAAYYPMCPVDGCGCILVKTKEDMGF